MGYNRNLTFIFGIGLGQTSGKGVLCLLQCGLNPFTLNPFQFNFEFGTTHRVGSCVVHPEQV